MAKIKRSISLDEEVIEEIEKMAEETGRSFSNYVNERLKDHIEEGE